MLSRPAPHALRALLRALLLTALLTFTLGAVDAPETQAAPTTRKGSRAASKKARKKTRKRAKKRPKRAKKRSKRDRAGKDARANAKKPRGVRIYWKWAWDKEECERKGRPQCVPPSRYRKATPSDKATSSWKKAVETAQYLLDLRPAHGRFIPFLAGGLRYVAYISPHTHTFRDLNGDGVREKVKLSTPVRGVSIFVRKVQPGRKKRRK